MPVSGNKRTAEVISIGDEMTSGARLDTNAQWLSQRLEELGVEVTFHSTVGDTLADNIDVFRIARRRADIIVSTGGLGPTRDDLTREALAKVLGVELELREPLVKHIEELFARFGREMPERNKVQAMFPVGSDEIFNSHGTAPGIDMMVPRDGASPSRVFASPGVPAEMKRMFHNLVAPRILQSSGSNSVIRQAVMKFFGAGESDMEQQLGDMIDRDRQPRVGITASTATISLRITAMGETESECEQMIADTREQILQRVGKFYFGDGDDFEQQNAIDCMLRQRQQSLLIIEYGYAALLGDWFAGLGETPSYRCGLSFAARNDLERLLPGNSTSQLQDRFQVDWILTVDQYPSLDAPDGRIPSADVTLEVIGQDQARYPKTIQIGGHPDIMHARIAKAAMSWLRKVINEQA